MDTAIFSSIFTTFRARFCFVFGGKGRRGARLVADPRLESKEVRDNDCRPAKKIRKKQIRTNHNNT